MGSILVVCTGNICRSPIAEGMIRAAFARTPGNDAVEVSSAGTNGWEGSEAMPESVEAAAERGVDISTHVARRLSDEMLDSADLVLCMAHQHREIIEAERPDLMSRTFTLKELVRLLEDMPDRAPNLQARVKEADDLRRDGFDGNPLDEDIADPLGLPIDTYRAVAWELEAWCERLVAGLAAADGSA
ncbi:MAG TPA: low molecular weight phosphatase family protein [Actinomycetota bacterium]|jgi:protein-tyrosine phosphatase|nr:low molecular weight phosphatase family protein [Actinomycetota bacterium]